MNAAGPAIVASTLIGVSNNADPVSEAQQEQAAKRQRDQTERAAGRNLDLTATEAIDLALALAPEVVDAPTPEAGERVIDLDFASLSEINFVRKRVNAALTVAEWLPEVAVWVWQADVHKRQPLSQRGREKGFELRLEQSPTRS